MQDLSLKIAAARSLHGIPFQNGSFPYSSIGQMLAERVQNTPDDTWLIEYNADGARSQWTYKQFGLAVGRLAAYMTDIGIGTTDRVAVLGYNHSDTVIQYFAIWWIGATVVPLNLGEDDDRLGYILQNSEAHLAFVRSEYAERFNRLQGQAPELHHTLLCDGLADGDFGRIISDTTISAPPFSADLQNQECLIVYTSGTTGHPKGVLLAQGNLLMDATGIGQWHGITAQTRMMCVLPIHHVNGIVVTLVTPMMGGASVVLNRKFQTSTFFQRIAFEGVNIVSVVPTLLAFLLEGDVDTGKLDLSKFSHIICGAGPLTCDLALNFQSRYNVPIVHGYGLSETTCYSCFLPVNLQEAEHKAWLGDYGFPSIGVPIVQNEMTIHDPEGNAVEPGVRGEIVIRGHNVMLGYYANPQANQDAFSYEWFRSGDEGFYQIGADKQHYFFITGRLKELIIRGGVNISPLEIDEVLNSHPKVAAGIALGFENHWYGEEVGAYVRRGDSSLSADELLAYCREHLPYFKAPKVIVFGDDIPVTSTGKYQRNKIKHLFSAYRETHFSVKET